MYFFPSAGETNPKGREVKQTKVLMLCGSMERGGAETHIETLCHGLTALGCEVTAVTTGGETAQRIEVSGIRVLYLPIQSKNPFIRLSVLKKLKALQRREGYDILHAHTRLSARFLKHIGRKKGVFRHMSSKKRSFGTQSAHTESRTPCEKIPAKIVTVHAAFRHFPFEKMLCYPGEWTVAVSEDLRRYAIRTYRIPPERIQVIPNGIALSRFSPSPERENRLKNAEIMHKAHTSCENAEDPFHAEHPVVIGFASRMDTDCALGATLLCELAPTLCRAFPGVTIRLAGGGSAFGEIRKKAERINDSFGREVITASGHLADMPSFLREIDIFVGVSRAALEAAAMGCAVILCGNEGYGGILSEESAPFYALSNFCVRNGGTPCAKVLENDLFLLLFDTKIRDFYAASAMNWVRKFQKSDRMCHLTLLLYHRALHTPKDRRILAGGYFGCGNLGDNAILLGIQDGIRELAPTVELTALSARPKRLSRRLDIQAFGRKSPLGMLCGMLGADLYLCGGGSLLQNKSGNRSLLYYLWTLFMGGLLGKRVVLFAAGIGPLSGKFARRMTVRTLKKCRYISLRDSDSFHLLRRIGLSDKALYVSADPALLLSPPPPTRAAFLLSEHGILQDVRCFCIILKGGRESHDMTRLLLAAARILSTRHGLRPILLCFDTHNDRRATALAGPHLAGSVSIPIEEVHDAIALLARAEFVLSMRLHGLILSTVATTPALGVVSDARDGKIPSFARAAGQEYLLPGEVSVGAVVDLAEKMQAERDTRIPFLRSTLDELRKKAKKDLANVLSMLYNKN